MLVNHPNSGLVCFKGKYAADLSGPLDDPSDVRIRPSAAVNRVKPQRRDRLDLAEDCRRRARENLLHLGTGRGIDIEASDPVVDERDDHILGLPIVSTKTMFQVVATGES